MTTFKIKNRILLLLAIFFIGIMQSCKKDDATVATKNIDAIFAANPDISLFQYAIKKAKLTSFTQGNGPYTFFAPNNAAINSYGIANEAAIDALDSNTLVQIITIHIQVNARTLVEIPIGPNAPMVTQGGFTQYATKYGTDAYVNGAKITTADILATNGIIHIIEKVLQPPTLNTLSLLGANPNYARMVQAINKAGIAATFTGTTGTFFAVPNSAMIAGGYDSAAIANLISPSTALTLLSNIMRYHVIPQRLFQQDFRTANYKTAQMQSANVAITVAAPSISIKGLANPAAFTVTIPSITTTNGVLYGINGLLKY